MSAIWASLITEDKKHFWEVADTTPELPPDAAWATFLRVHDELTLQMVDPDTRKIVADNLEPKGAEFRKGWGVSGRMANFLDKDPVRIKQAFAIMMSLPGIPIIYYGDEIGELNNFDFAHEYAAQREATQKKNNPHLDIISFYDSRDVNRGPVSRDKLYAALKQPHTYSGAIFQSVRNLIAARKANPALVSGNLQEIKTNRPELLAYLRQTDTEHVAVVNNLSQQAETVALPLPDAIFDAMPKKGTLVNLQDQSRVAYQKAGNALTLSLKPYDSLWLKLP
jgi:maltose alpha-D-glucosyltransferase/alpha-amylase